MDIDMDINTDKDMDMDTDKDMDTERDIQRFWCQILYSGIQFSLISDMMSYSAIFGPSLKVLIPFNTDIGRNAHLWLLFYFTRPVYLKSRSSYFLCFECFYYFFSFRVTLCIARSTNQWYWSKSFSQWKSRFLLLPNYFISTSRKAW